MDNIYEWLGISADATETEILAAIAAKKQNYQLNTSQEVHIKQVLLTPHLRKHHDLRMATAGHGVGFSGGAFAPMDLGIDDTASYTPAENHTVIRTKLKKRKTHPSNIMYLCLAIAVLAFLLNLLFKLNAI